MQNSREVLAFIRLENDQDLILIREQKEFEVSWRKSLVPHEVFTYECEDDAYEGFDKAARFLEEKSSFENIQAG